LFGPQQVLMTLKLVQPHIYINDILESKFDAPPH